MSTGTASPFMTPITNPDPRSGVTTSVATVEAPLALADGEVRFVAPLLGLEHLDVFSLVELAPDSPLLSLRSAQDDRVRLLVVDPDDVVVGYEPGFDALAKAAVGLRSDEAGRVLVVVSPGASLAESTVNLLAPVLVNPATGAAAQVVLTGSDLPLRQPLAA